MSVSLIQNGRGSRFPALTGASLSSLSYRYPEEKKGPKRRLVLWNEIGRGAQHGDLPTLPHIFKGRYFRLQVFDSEAAIPPGLKVAGRMGGWGFSNHHIGPRNAPYIFRLPIIRENDCRLLEVYPDLENPTHRYYDFDSSYHIPVSELSKLESPDDNSEISEKLDASMVIPQQRTLDIGKGLRITILIERF